MTPAKNHFDVIIVGAGPAGATLGYELSKKGVDVLILEKEKLPRYKACGGAVTPKSVRLLGCDIGPVTRGLITGARVSYKLGKPFVKRYHNPIAYMVMRDEFDQFLVSRAREAGSNVADAQGVLSVQAMEGGVEVSTNGGSMTARILVGADGATSVVARSLGSDSDRELGVAMEAEVLVSKNDLARWDSLAGIDLGSLRGGYGWVFPKKDHLSVGVGAPVKRAKGLPSYHKRLLQSLNLETCRITNLKGHLLPVRRPAAPLCSDRIMLLGDAAGLIDPLSGEGIYNAIKSAQLAAPVITERLVSSQVDLSEYQRVVEVEILPELRIAKRMHALFSWFPHLSFFVLRRNNRVWNASCGVASGDRNYASLRKRLGLFKFVLGT